MWGIVKHEFHAFMYISCNFHQNIVSSDMSQCHSPWCGGCQTHLEFWEFHAISNKLVSSESGPNPLWRSRNRKCEFCVALDIPLNFHHECFPWIGLSTPSPFSIVVVLSNMSFMYSSGHLMQFLGENIFYTDPNSKPMTFLYTSGYFIQFLPKVFFPLTSPCPPAPPWGVEVGKMTSVQI